MVFSIKNGLKMTGYHFHDINMVVAFCLFALPSVVILGKWGLFPATLWLILEMAFIIFVRCRDDPVKLGYEVDTNG